MEAILRIKAGELSEADLQQLTDDLCQTLNHEGGLDAALATEQGGRGLKTPDPIIIGKIALTLIGSGGAIVALINVLNTYVSRPNHIEIEISNEKGEIVRIAGDHLRPEQLSQTTRLINRLLGVRE